MHKQQGFSHILAIVLVLALLGAVGYMGWQAYTKNSETLDTNTKTESSDTKNTATKTTWLQAGTAFTGKYADADIVELGDGSYRMYYADQPPMGMGTSPSPPQMGVHSSVSTDGVTWKKESGYRYSNASFPEVVKLKDGRWRMYFQSNLRIKSAISTDGLNFTAEAGDRMGLSNPAGLDLTNVAAPTVLQLDDGKFVMIYRGTLEGRYTSYSPNTDTNLLLWATSSNGLKFTVKGVAVDTRNDTLVGSLDGPNLVKWDDGKYRLFSTSYTGVYSFTFDGSKFGEPVLELAGEAKRVGDQLTGQPPGDPTLIKIDDVWHMFYGQAGDTSGFYYAVLK